MSFIPETGPQPVDVEGVPTLYGDGRTKQAFKDETDVNKIIERAQRQGSLSHLVRHGAQYGDFSDVPSLLQAHENLERGRKIFEELPSEVRKEFGQDMFRFFEYVNDPANAGNLQELLPELAQPGKQLPDVVRSAASAANPAIVDAPAEPAADAGDPPPASSST